MARANSGDGTTTQRTTPADVPGLTSGVTSVSAGNFHTCAIVSGAAKCWGDNGLGALGDNSTTQRLAPVNVTGMGSGVTSITANNGYSCAVVSGAAKCWGINSSGQLGDNSTTQRLTAVNVAGLSIGSSSISAGSAHACALTTLGALKCWGFNGSGQLGDNSTVQRLSPVFTLGLGSSGGIAIAAGANHTCAITSGGAVDCWGLNNSGQLGDGTQTQRQSPVTVAALSGEITAIAAQSNETCVLTSAGGVKCWGHNSHGQLGDNTNVRRPSPVDVTGLGAGVIEIAVGGQHACARTAVGGVKCWGRNVEGQIGDNSTTDRWTPVDVPGLSAGVAAIAAGETHTCALLSGGSVRCWGDNIYGQLGDNTSTPQHLPSGVPGLGGVIAIAAGYMHTCALVSGGGVKCWGLIQGPKSGITRPRRVALLPTLQDCRAEPLTWRLRGNTLSRLLPAA